MITRNISPVPIRNAFADQTKAGGPLVHGEGGNTMSRAWTQWFQEVQNPSLSAADNLTAHPGGGQALATPVTTSVARFRTVGSTGDSALLPATAPGLQITVINSGAKSLNVFPQGTDGINGAAVFAVPSQSQQIFTCSNQGDWFTGAVAGGGGGGGGTGTVTSVGLAAPVEFTVSGSPVTSSGTLTLTKASEAANTVWAGPASGSAAVPGFRPLVPNDIPSGVTLISSNYMVTGADNGMLLVANVSGSLTITLPNPPPLASFDVSIENPTPGALSISPNGLLLDGSASSLSVSKNQGLYIATDGVNYYSERGMGTGGGGGGTPGGTTGQLQYNSSGAFAGAAGSSVAASGAIGLGAAPAAGYDLDLTASAANGGTAHVAKSLTVSGSPATINLDATGSSSASPVLIQGSSWTASSAFRLMPSNDSGGLQFISGYQTQMFGYNGLRFQGMRATTAPPAFIGGTGNDPSVMIDAPLGGTGPALQVNGLANFSASPTAPTPSAGDSSTKVATTAFVGGALTTGPYRLNRVFMILTSQTYTPTAGTRALYVEAMGAGGGGGGVTGGTAACAAGGGGGGGAYSAAWLDVVNGKIQASYTLTLGAGGAGGATTGAAGSAGGNTTLVGVSPATTYVVAAGGSGGSGMTSGTAAAAAAGGGGGTASSGTGDLLLSGSSGQPAVRLAATQMYIGSGGAGFLGSSPAYTSSWFIGLGVAGPSVPTNTNVGSGGGGAYSQNNAAAFTALNGGNGIVRVWEFL